jgi:hypothetical protein
MDFGKMKLSHNDIEKIDRGKWRKYNPYNPYVEENKEEIGKNVQVVDNLFDENDKEENNVDANTRSSCSSSTTTSTK